MAKLNNLKKDLRKFERPEKEKIFIRYFKAGKGGLQLYQLFGS